MLEMNFLHRNHTIRRKKVNTTMDTKTLRSFCVFMLCISPVTPKDTNSPVIQLAGLDKRCQGAVQVWKDNHWHSLCETALNSDLSAGICKMLNCGETILHGCGQELNVSLPFLNVTCGLLEDIRNCSFSQVAEDECGGAAFLNCTEPVLRLSGSHGPCAGRVEVFMDGVWGTVCPDGWDARDAMVTCQQMNCGSALSSWTGSSFGRGSPQVHLNEVDCRGSEKSLWECSASRKQNCSTGEDAGVICTAHRTVRLSGGANSCSGRVEVYLHGVWATVCDNHWYEDDSIMLCKYLGCGSFQNQTKHEHSLIYAAILCHKARTLWDCKVYKQRTHICYKSKAVGLICQGAINDSRANETRTIGITNNTTPGFGKVHVDLQYLVIACAVLTALLLASIFIFSVIILILQRQKKIFIQNASLPRSNGRWNSREDKEPDFSLHFLPPCPSPRLQSKEPVPAAIPLVPTITTTLEDEEDYGFSSAPLKPLVTFHEEKKMEETATATRACDGKQRRRIRSANSERSSSTSSEEQNWYENYRQQVTRIFCLLHNLMRDPLNMMMSVLSLLTDIRVD